MPQTGLWFTKHVIAWEKLLLIYKAIKVLTGLGENKQTREQKHLKLSLDTAQVLDVALKLPATVELRVIILILKGGMQRGWFLTFEGLAEKMRCLGVYTKLIQTD